MLNIPITEHCITDLDNQVALVNDLLAEVKRIADLSVNNPDGFRRAHIIKAKQFMKRNNPQELNVLYLYLLLQTLAPDKYQFIEHPVSKLMGFWNKKTLTKKL